MSKKELVDPEDPDEDAVDGMKEIESTEYEAPTFLSCVFVGAFSRSLSQRHSRRAAVFEGELALQHV